MQPQNKFYWDIDVNKFYIKQFKDFPDIYNDEAVIESLKNLLNTKKGSRIFRPQFGCDIEQFLFDQLDDVSANLLIKKIISCISKNEPRIEDLKVKVDILYDEEKFDITLYFKIKSTGNFNTLNFQLERIR